RPAGCNPVGMGLRPTKGDENPPPDARRIFNGLQWVFDRAPQRAGIPHLFYVELYLTISAPIGSAARSMAFAGTSRTASNFIGSHPVSQQLGQGAGSGLVHGGSDGSFDRRLECQAGFRHFQIESSFAGNLAL